MQSLFVSSIFFISSVSAEEPFSSNNYYCSKGQQCLINDTQALERKDVTGQGLTVLDCQKACDQNPDCQGVDTFSSFWSFVDGEVSTCVLLRAHTFNSTVGSCTRNPNWIACIKKEHTTGMRQLAAQQASADTSESKAKASDARRADTVHPTPGETFVSNDYVCTRNQRCLINDNQALERLDLRDRPDLNFFLWCQNACNHHHDCQGVDMFSVEHLFTCVLLRAGTFDSVIGTCTRAGGNWMACIKKEHANGGIPEKKTVKNLAEEQAVESKAKAGEAVQEQPASTDETAVVSRDHKSSKDASFIIA